MRRNFKFRRFKKKFYIQSPVSVFLFLMLYFMLDGLLLFRKGDFCGVRCLRMIFKGRILGGAHHFQGDPYLNSTVVLFDR